MASEPKLEITFDNAEMKVCFIVDFRICAFAEFSLGSQVDEAHMGSKKDADSSKSQVYVFFNVEQRDAMVGLIILTVFNRFCL